MPSTISCAIRVSVRSIASASRTVFASEVCALRARSGRCSPSDSFPASRDRVKGVLCSPRDASGRAGRYSLGRAGASRSRRAAGRTRCSGGDSSEGFCASERLEGRPDPAVELGRLAAQARSQVAAARERPALEPERLCVVALFHLDTGPVLLLARIERAVVLPATQPDQPLQALERLAECLHLVGRLMNMTGTSSRSITVISTGAAGSLGPQEPRCRMLLGSLSRHVARSFSLLAAACGSSTHVVSANGVKLEVPDGWTQLHPASDRRDGAAHAARRRNGRGAPGVLALRVAVYDSGAAVSVVGWPSVARQAASPHAAGPRSRGSWPSGGTRSSASPAAVPLSTCSSRASATRCACSSATVRRRRAVRQALAVARSFAAGRLNVRDRDQPLDRVFDPLGELALGPGEAGLVLLVEIRSKVEMCFRGSARAPRLASWEPRCEVPQSVDLGEARREQLGLELLCGREPLAVDALHRREQLVQPERVEVGRVEGDDREAAARRRARAAPRRTPARGRPGATTAT